MSPASKFVNAKKGGKLRAGCVHRLFREGRARLVDDASRVSSAAPDPRSLTDPPARASIQNPPPSVPRCVPSQLEGNFSRQAPKPAAGTSRFGASAPASRFAPR